MENFKAESNNSYQKEEPRPKENQETGKRIKWRNSASFFLTAGFFVFFGWFLFFSRAGEIRQSPELFKASDQKAQMIASENTETMPDFSKINLEAKSAYVFDVAKNTPVFELNSDIQLPLASLTKIMTAIVAAENLPSYLEVAITQEAISQDGDDGFLVEEKWLLADLLDAMLVSSSNDAAFALALELKRDFDKDFVALMNQKAKELELTQTYFINPTGLDISKTNAGAYGSAKDIAKLLLYTLKNHPVLMEATRSDEIYFGGRKFRNTNRIANDLPGFIAGKTGYSELAGGNLAIIADRGYGHLLIVVVLGSTPEGRFSDVKTLYNALISDKIKL